MGDRKRINPRRPIPSSGYDLLRKNLKSGFAEGFPVEKGSFPPSDNRASINRGRLTTRKDDKVKDVSIGLQDHDEAIMYYFNEVIKPSVLINGDRTPVPVIYGAPERWKGVQKDGFYRDKEGKIQVPLIMFKRDRVIKRRDLGNKLDGNNPQLYYTFQEKYTKRNQYDNFSVLQNRMPQREFHAIVVPDFVKLEYSCIIWCDYVAQMNKLIEMINYTSDSYWGDKNRFKFNAKIDTYDNRTEVSQGDNRVVKTNFGLTLQGYLVPDSINKELTKKPQKFFSKSTVIFNNELEIEASGAPLTREEVRSKQGPIKSIEGEGIGFESIQTSDNATEEGPGVGGFVVGGDGDASLLEPFVIGDGGNGTADLFFDHLPANDTAFGTHTVVLTDANGNSIGFEIGSPSFFTGIVINFFVNNDPVSGYELGSPFSNGLSWPINSTTGYYVIGSAGNVTQVGTMLAMFEDITNYAQESGLINITATHDNSGVNMPENQIHFLQEVEGLSGNSQIVMSEEFQSLLVTDNEDEDSSQTFST